MMRAFVLEDHISLLQRCGSIRLVTAMVTDEGFSHSAEAARRLMSILEEQRVRCREILSRQEERFRLAGETITQYFQALLDTPKVQTGKDSPQESSLADVAAMVASLESAVAALREEREHIHRQAAERAQALQQMGGELAALREELAALRSLKQQLESQLAAAQRAMAENEMQWKAREAELRREFEKQQNLWASQWNEREATLNALVLRAAQLEEELETLRKQANSPAPDEIRERYNLATAEIRELRQRNAELEKKIAELEQRSTKAERLSSDGRILDWEAEKQRILAALEAEVADQDPERPAEHARLQEVIKKTETILAEKDREIAELRRLLEEQATNIGSVAVGAAALERLLDQDEVIRQQREHLRQLEEEWKEKLRKAELEISLERAKLAREKALLEERQRELEEKLQNLEKMGQPAEKTKAARGRWLTRLGLNGNSES